MAPKTTYCTIYLARHGQSQGNLGKFIQGHQDADLTPLGIEQAQVLARHFHKIRFAAVFSSDLLRARRTAQAVALDRRLAITTARALRERKFGRIEGMLDSKFEQDFRELLDSREKLNHQDRFRFKLAPDVESDEELMSRFITHLRGIATAYLSKNVLVVSHGGPIRTLLIHLGFATYKEMPPAGGTVSNTAYVKLLSDGIDFFVKDTFGITKIDQ